MTNEAGPNIVYNGLVLNFDLANPRNATSNTPTNFVQGGSFPNGANSPQELNSDPTNTIMLMPNPGDTGYVLRQNGYYTEYQLNIDNVGMTSNTTYVMSGWYAKSADYNSVDTMFHSRAFSTSGAHIATGNGVGTLIYSKVVDGLTWEYRYATITTPADFNNNFDWYVGYGADNTTGYRYYTNLKLERGTYPSLLDLSGNLNNGIGENSPVFSSGNNGSLFFDGVNDYISIPNSTSLQVSNNFTISAWINANSLSQRYGIFSTRTQNTAGSWQLEVGWGSASTPGVNRVAVTGLGTWIYESGNNVINLNTWTNICYVSSTNSMYINGVLVPAGVAQAYTILNNSDVKVIGSGTIFAQMFSGNISSVLLYSLALTQSQILQNYNATKGRFGL